MSIKLDITEIEILDEDTKSLIGKVTTWDESTIEVNIKYIFSKKEWLELSKKIEKCFDYMRIEEPKTLEEIEEENK